MVDTCKHCIYYGDEINPSWCRRHGIETEPSHSCDSWEERYEDQANKNGTKK